MRGFLRMAAGVLVVASASLDLAGGAAAQTYPNKPVRIIVPIAPGSVTDVILRAAVDKINPRFGQNMIIENRPGASGIIGAQACAKADPDGYSICAVYHNTMSFNPHLFNKLPYDPEKDFEPITSLFFLTEVLAVSSATAAKNPVDLRKLAETQSDKLNFGTLGHGSLPELLVRWMNNQWSTRIAAVPFTGGGPIAQAMTTNEIQIGNMGLGNFLGQIEAGTIRPLAVTTAERSKLLPDVPTFKEAGLGAFSAQAWWGLAAPKGTPPQAIAAINKQFVQLFQEPEFKDFLEKRAVQPFVSSPQAFAAFLKEDRAGAAKIVEIAKQPRQEYKQ
ncbi:MAG: tripartite tricarboxylate transporter substrate binding protein [Beijerinckiaceae bacterium]|jgi:tripartite-type tricarboxylate transporter receptor subunit TctC|nr:tripartite tricarboxylate transporter substrate binding protein [Beijerinckiaceae bacterium]